MRYLNFTLPLLVLIAVVAGCVTAAVPTQTLPDTTATRAVLATEIAVRLTATASAIQSATPTTSPSSIVTSSPTALPTATPTRTPSPSPSPTSLVKPVDSIAFVSDRDHQNTECLADPRFCPKEIYLMKPDGSGQQRLTTGDGWRSDDEIMRVTWNSDRSRILFNLDESKSLLLDLRGQVLKQFSFVMWPDYSPNGKYISFGDSTPNGYPSGIALFVMNIDQSDRHILTYPSGQGSDWGYGYSSWSPDSSEIAFSRAYAGKGIWIIKADGTGLRQVSKSIRSERLAWSPDGTKIAFEGGGIYPEFDIWMVDLRVGTMVNLTKTTNEYELFPTWSPDSRQIAFQRMPHQAQPYESQIFVMGADGSNVKQLTSVGHNYAPAWAR